MSKNKTLSAAKSAKNDEFYTQYADILYEGRNEMKFKDIVMFVRIVVVAMTSTILAGCVQQGGASVPLAARFDDVSSSLGGTWADETGRSLLVVTCPHVCWMQTTQKRCVGGVTSAVRFYDRLALF